MFNYCPSCGSKKITFKEGKLFNCPDCSFVYYQNTAAATGCLITVPEPDGERLLFLVRGKEPAIGKLDLPGGFIDIGEGAVEGLYRELQEELGWTPPVPEGASLYDVFQLIASFPNVYEYKGVKYNTCDLYFSVSAPGLKPDALHLNAMHLEEAEVTAALFLKPQEIDFSRLAFPSTVQAVKKYLDILSRQNV